MSAPKNKGIENMRNNGSRFFVVGINYSGKNQDSMLKTGWLIVLLVSVSVLSSQNLYKRKIPVSGEVSLSSANYIHSEKPAIPSPVITQSGRELILIKTENDKYVWLDGTVENGDPFDYKRRLYGKGNQLQIDGEDFPHYAKSGIHSLKDLQDAKRITGRSVAQITVDARPWSSSGVGFVADDETIISVIYADNKMVKELGLSHRDMARPLFHLWNVSRHFQRSNDENTPKAMIYNGGEVEFRIRGSRGWQESIFNDEILGTGHIELWRQLTHQELNFLEKKYDYLLPDQMEELKKELSYIHTGEMVLFYISRYGFYEGHNEYRVDPVSVASVFGLRTIEELHEAAGNKLYDWFTTHFTFNPE